MSHVGKQTLPLQAHQRKIRVSIPQARKTGGMESLGLNVIVIGLAEAVRNGRLTQDRHWKYSL